MEANELVKTNTIKPCGGVYDDDDDGGGGGGGGFQLMTH